MDPGNLLLNRRRSPSGSPARRRDSGSGKPGISAPIWMTGAVTVTAACVLLTGTGLDVLLLVLICCAVVALERTIGDWTAEWLGPALASVVLAISVGAAVWFLFAKNGQAEQFYAAAERSGYGTLLHSKSTSPEPDQPATDTPPASADDSPQVTSGRNRRTIAGAVDGTRGSTGRTSRTPTASASAWTLLRRSPSLALVVRIETPEVSVTGRSITIRARVSAGGEPIADLPVSFSVDGRPAGSGVTDSQGMVDTSFLPKAPRTYQVEATVAASEDFRATSARRVLHVLPAGSALARGSAY